MKNIALLLSLFLVSIIELSAQKTFKINVNVKGINTISGKIYGSISNYSSEFPAASNKCFSL